MKRFSSDYVHGAHPAILERLCETNMEETPGYGEDEYCERARVLIRKAVQNEKAQVHFLVGGTQTNTTVIAAALRPHQGVLTAESGHVAVHETGAIEAVNHKVITLQSSDGKLNASQIDAYVEGHFKDESFEHMVQPKMVYLSHPTELGTLYTKKELEEIAAICKKWDLYFYLDGARLGYGLGVSNSDVTLPLLGELCDVFYIGGTKVGALFGEAVVITNPQLMKDFRYIIKQNGGMLAKGRLLGVQFQRMFEDDLYLQMGRHGIEMANLLREGFEACGLSFLIDSPTNQIFPILKDSMIEELRKDFDFSYQQRMDEQHSAVRFCTCWATKEEDVSALINKIKELTGN